jgi:hypothetical protein
VVWKLAVKYPSYPIMSLIQSNYHPNPIPACVVAQCYIVIGSNQIANPFVTWIELHSKLVICTHALTRGTASELWLYALAAADNSCGLPFALTVKAHRRAFGESPGGDYRTVEVKRDARKAQA